MSDSKSATAMMLDVTIKFRTDDAVQIAYKIVNHSEHSIYLFDKLFETYDPNKGYLLDPNLCNISVADKIIIISKKIFPVPPMTSVYMPNIPCVSRLDAGQSLSATLLLPLPLKLWNPYSRPPAQSAKGRPQKMKCRFEIGYFVAQDGAHALATRVKSTQGQVLRFYPFNIASQTVMQSDSFAELLPVQIP